MVGQQIISGNKEHLENYVYFKTHLFDNPKERDMYYEV